MTDEQTQQLQQLDEEVFNAIHEVDGALESGEEQRQLAAGRLVAEVSEKYRAFIAQLSAGEQLTVERKTGRRLIDLRRTAMALSRRDSGARVERSHDAGFVPFIEQRMPSKSIMSERAAPQPGQVSVGGEIESWCGKCKEMRTHHVVAMVSGEAKQVVCQMCNSRHAHKAEPPKSRRASEETSGTPTATASAPQRTDQGTLRKREEARSQLQNELFAVENPREFDPKARYKAGEIIVHPLHGRGKIENITRGSLLVRFVDGLKPLDLR